MPRLLRKFYSRAVILDPAVIELAGGLDPAAVDALILTGGKGKKSGPRLAPFARLPELCLIRGQMPFVLVGGIAEHHAALRLDALTDYLVHDVAGWRQVWEIVLQRYRPDLWSESGARVGDAN